MKLLPRAEIVAPEAQVAARVVPAESVGGDFYNLFRLVAEPTGIMIGDVSSHGYHAALIMALAMSASAIHAQASPDPDAVLASLEGTLREELETTEMFITAFYGVIDRVAKTLRYANTGHPHAFHVCVRWEDRAARRDRPAASAWSSGCPHARSRSWTPTAICSCSSRTA